MMRDFYTVILSEAKDLAKVRGEVVRSLARARDDCNLWNTHRPNAKMIAQKARQLLRE
jgi:hypothetical protein